MTNKKNTKHSKRQEISVNDISSQRIENFKATRSSAKMEEQMSINSNRDLWHGRQSVIQSMNRLERNHSKPGNDCRSTHF